MNCFIFYTLHNAMIDVLGMLQTEVYLITNDLNVRSSIIVSNLVLVV